MLSLHVIWQEKSDKNESVRNKRVKKAWKRTFGRRKALSENIGENKSKKMLLCFWRTWSRILKMCQHWTHNYVTRPHCHLVRLRYNFLLTCIRAILELLEAIEAIGDLFLRWFFIFFEYTLMLLNYFSTSS